MIYDADVLTEFYDTDTIASSLDDDEISHEEEGFMRGYLNYRGF